MKFDREALRGGVHVADGGWSTRLQMRGLPTDVMAETANLTHPELVIELGRAYLDAGSRVITTNTFAANKFNVERRGVDATVKELNKQGAALAKEAVGDREALVVGSCGPSGKILAVREAKPDDLMRVFDEQITGLADGGADVILLETFSETAEILLALKVAKDVTALPVFTSMSFDSGPQKTRTMMGAKAEECAAALEDGGADVVGCNCGTGVEDFLPAVVALRGATTLPLWAKPNAGMPELVDGQAVYRQTPEQFITHVPQLLEAGVNIIGGCCGTGPEHIEKLAGLVARRG